MNAISQTIFSNAFSWMKMFEFWSNFHWSLFPRVQLTIFQHWFRYWRGAIQATSHYLDQWWFVYRRIYALLGLNELTAWVGIRSGNGLSPARRQALTWTNAGLLSIEPNRTNVREIWTSILKFSVQKMQMEISFAKMSIILFWPQCAQIHCGFNKQGWFWQKIFSNEVSSKKLYDFFIQISLIHILRSAIYNK